MTKKAFITIVLLCVWVTVTAQWSMWPYGWIDDTSRTTVHLSVGSAVGAGFGRTDAISWVAPSVGWRANERLTLRGGFALAGSLLPGGYALHGRTPHSLAPLREGTRMGAAWAQAEYRPNERLTLWASVMRLTGYAQPLWAPQALPIDATEVSGGLAYRFSQGSVLAMHFRFVHDEYGYLLHPPYGHAYYGPLAPEYTLFNGPWPF